jgi:protein-disulfide isomerase
MLRVSIARRGIFRAAICSLAFLAAGKVVNAQSTWDVMLRSTPTMGERSLGRSDAKVIVLEYASATCPHCAMFHVHAWPQIRRDYVDTGKVRWIIRELPLDSLSMAAFMLARCMPAEQYFDTINELFLTQKAWMVDDPRSALWRIMKNRMSREEFDSCLARQDLSEAIYQTAKQAVEEFEIKSTPTFLINGERVRGAQEAGYFKTLLERKLREFTQ